jgi:hypothetical protein
VEGGLTEEIVRNLAISRGQRDLREFEECLKLMRALRRGGGARHEQARIANGVLENFRSVRHAEPLTA